MWTEFHLKEVEDLVEMLFGFIVIKGLDVLDLIVYSRVKVFLDVAMSQTVVTLL